MKGLCKNLTFVIPAKPVPAQAGSRNSVLPSFLRKRLCKKHLLDRVTSGKPNPLNPPYQGDLSLNSPLIRGARGVRNDECWFVAQPLARITARSAADTVPSSPPPSTNRKRGGYGDVGVIGAAKAALPGLRLQNLTIVIHFQLSAGFLLARQCKKPTPVRVI